MFAARDKPPAVEVEVVGLADEVKQNVEAHLSIAKLGKRGEQPDPPAASTPPEESVRRLHAAARKEIEEALQPFGYYEPAVSSTLQRADGGWLARYDVNPGDPTLLDEVEIRVLGEGRDEPGMRDALAAIELSAGDVLNHPRYEAAKQRLFNAAYEAGYIDVGTSAPKSSFNLASARPTSTWCSRPGRSTTSATSRSSRRFSIRA